jgi:hypothetical protein
MVPPPDFDLDTALHSLARFRARQPSGLAFAHYGLVPVDVDETLEEADATLRRWGEVAEVAWRDGRDIAEALDEAFSHELDHVDPEYRAMADTLNSVHSNAAGLRRWLETRGADAGAASHPHPHPHDHPHPH